MGRFDRQIATAKRLIQKNGQLVTWRSLVTEIDDEDKPWNGGDSDPTDHDVYICFVSDKSKEMRQLYKYVTGSEVPIGALPGLMAAVEFEPKEKDVVIRDGVELRIQQFDVLNPNGQIILYMLEFEG